MSPLPPSCTAHHKPDIGFLLLLGLVLLAAGGKSILSDTLDPDCFWHLRVGEQLQREGIHPLVDSLSFSSIRNPWTPYSWLAELGMNRLWNWGGFRAAILVTALLVIGTMMMICLACREIVRASQDDRPGITTHSAPRLFATLLATVFAAILSLAYLSFRPVTLALFLLSTCIMLIFRDRRLSERSHAVWLVPLIVVVMVNVHLFAFLVPIWFGLLLLGAVWESLTASEWIDRLDRIRSLRRYGLLLIASSLSCAMTPMLPGLLTTMRDYTLHDPMVASTVIAEMQPFWHGGMGKVSLLLFILFATTVVWHRRRLRAGELLLLLAGTALLFWKGRFAPLFALVAAPVFAVTLPELSDAVLGRGVLRGAVAALLLVGIARIALAFPSRDVELSAWLNRNGPDAPGYPTEAAEFVASQLPHDGSGRRLINEFNWGGYLAWKLGDTYQVLLDGRTQVYTPAFWEKLYLGEENSRRQTLADAHANAAIVPVGKSRFRRALLALGWRIVHHDARADVLIPPGSSYAGVDFRPQ